MSGAIGTLGGGGGGAAPYDAPGGPAGGQLSGTYPNPSVVGLTDAGAQAYTIPAISAGGILSRSAATIASLVGSVQGSLFLWSAGDSLFKDSSRAWGIGETATVGLLLENTTAATSGTDQFSPSIKLAGRYWKNSTASDTCTWSIYVKSVASTDDRLSELDFAQADGTVRFALWPKNGTYGSYFAGRAYMGDSVWIESNLLMNISNWLTGHGTSATVGSYTTDRVFQIVNSGRADAANNIVNSIVYSPNTASITNASTMRVLSVGWANNAYAYTELQACFADGLFWAARGYSCSAPWAIGETQTDGLVLENTTAATDSLDQFSPSLRFGGNYYNTGSSGSATSSVRAYLATAKDSSHASGNLKFQCSDAGGSYSDILDIKCHGTYALATASSKWISAGSVSVAGMSIKLNSNTGLGSNAHSICSNWDDTPMVYSQEYFSDAASRVCHAFIYDHSDGAGAPTNAATMRGISVGWNSNSDVYTEVVAAYLDGRFWSAKGISTAGDPGSGVAGELTWPYAALAADGANDATLGKAPFTGARSAWIKVYHNGTAYYVPGFPAA